MAVVDSGPTSLSSLRLQSSPSDDLDVFRALRVMTWLTLTQHARDPTDERRGDGESSEGGR